MSTQTVVVVGSSVGGVRTAQALRREGFAGRIVLVGEESAEPYDKPPLSKQYLAGEWALDRLALLTATGTNISPVYSLVDDPDGHFKRALEAAVGRPLRFVQDNHSLSARGVLRGLHYQRPNPQGKLVRVTRGEVLPGGRRRASPGSRCPSTGRCRRPAAWPPRRRRR